MNGYVCFYNGRKVEVRANTSYMAQGTAAAIFGLKPKMQYKINVVLAERNGETVAHSTAAL